MKQQIRNIGVDVMQPAATCSDANCPFHGTIRLRGKIFSGRIIKADFNRTATIEFERNFFIPKYERYERRRTRIKVHNPSCLNAKIGDNVTAMECKPLSKSKSFVIIEVNKK